LRELSLEDDVVVSLGRARIESDAVRLRLEPEGGAVVEGEARLAFCPCPEPPVAIAFSGGSVDPGGDITLRFPRLEVLGVPIFVLPWIWIRPPHRVGLLPPQIAWRGADGLLVGTGAHVPWVGGDGAPRVVEVTAAGYVQGGVEIGGRLETPSSTTRITWDWLRGSRVEVDARGFYPATMPFARGGQAGAAWDVDVLQGDRARARSPSLEVASKPFDALAAETSLRLGSDGGRVSGLVATGLSGRAWRGDGRAAVGPTGALELGGPLGAHGAWDGSLGGAVLRDSRLYEMGLPIEPGSTPTSSREGSDGAVPLAVGLLGAELNVRPGPFELRVSTRERVRAASRGVDGSVDVAASGRVEVGVPLARRFGKEAPLIHVIEPALEAQAAALHARGSFFQELEARAADEGALTIARWIAAAKITSSLGRYAGPSGRASVRAGFLGWRAEEARAVVHASAAARTGWLAGDLEGAVVGGDTTGGAAAYGYALLARARAGPEGGVMVRAEVSAQGGAGASEGASAPVARALAGGAGGPYAGELAFLAMDGWTGGAGLTIPWSPWLRTSGRAVGDLTGARLLAAGGVLEITHPCGCFALAAAGGYRFGREGIDATLTIDLMPTPPMSPSRAAGSPPPPP
jgi:hypothetical protein